MNKTINRSNSSTQLIVSLGISMTLALAIFFPMKNAFASTSPNIIGGPSLTVGSTGQGVVVLQSLLSEMGYLEVPAGTAFGYYGALTRSAVAKFQTSMSISPSIGYFGPFTEVGMYQYLESHGYLDLLGWRS